jgi:hypothetical protein
MLMDQWPTDTGPARHKAQMTVLDAFNQQKSPEEVRQALLVAAVEAHLNFRDDDQAP